MESARPLALVVDDDPTTLSVVDAMLSAAGYGVLTAEDGEQALALIEEHGPSYLITDWTMPKMSGLELCRRVRAAGLPHYTYTMVLTARSATEDLVEGLQAGADEFICKTTLRTELLPRMQTARRIIDLEKRLLTLAKTDSLTGLPTRRALFEQFERELGRARRFRAPLSCVMLDVDYFKRINDSLGHSAGDRVLKALSDLLRGGIRVTDVVGRYGGEEFCVLLPETTEHAAMVWAERMRQTVADSPITIDDQPVRVTVSFGVAELLDDNSKPEDLIELADQALLVAKQCGRNQVVRYSELHESTAMGLGLLRDARQVLRRLKAGEVMSSLVSCLRDDESVARATEFFLRFRINSAPVVDASGKLVGILSEKDVLALLTSPDTWQRPVRDAMKKHVVCYDLQTSVEQIYDFLCRVSLRRVIIVQGGYPVGSISRGTLLRWYANWLAAHRGGTWSGADSTLSQQTRWRSGLHGTTQTLVQSAMRLHRQLDADPSHDELLPILVASVSEMQELVNDLLADTRMDGPAAEPVAALPA